VATEKQLQDAVAVELRFVFVEMLFALTIAEVATQVAALTAAGIGLRTAPSSYTHLVLATILIATSWIGWKNSAAKGNKLPVNEVFGLGFLVLLLDVTLVVFYFIITKGVELPVAGEIKPSAAHDTAWLFAVFVGYFVWDILTKAVPEPDPVVVAEGTTPPPHRGFGRRLFGKELWERGWKTVLCVLLAALIWFLVRNLSTQGGVVLADVSLISLTLFFRAFKEWKSGESKGWIVTCGIVLTLSLIGALLWPAGQSLTQ
jgi:hypothetical protein